MLPTTLNTNEVKDSSGTEIEFSRLSTLDRKLVFNESVEAPNAPHRITVEHREVGSGLSRRRQSRILIEKSITGQVDDAVTEKISANLAVNAPIGNMTAVAELANVIAEMLSFCATTGSGTTVLFDGSGNGAAALINGTL
jgi:uncharacterized protein (DUF736 family)